MQGAELKKMITEQRRSNHSFIKWWRKENDFVDVEPIDTFLENFSPGDEIGGFELMDMEQMWDLLLPLCPGRLIRVSEGGQDMVEWTYTTADKEQKTSRCLFAPDMLMKVFDVETRGNYIE